MSNRISARIRNSSIKNKITFIVIGTIILMLGVCIYMYYNINRISSRIDAIYADNVKLNEIEDELRDVQDNLTEYLNTKSSYSLEEYYRASRVYLQDLDVLDSGILDEHNKLMEHNIHEMSKNYLLAADNTVEAKRGRNIEKYRTLYEETTEIYGFINAHISSLNRQRFRDNVVSYKALSESITYLEGNSIFIFVVLSIFDVLLVILLTRNITRPLQELADEANKVSEGKLDKAGVVQVHGMDEVGVVTVAFNQMVSSIPGYMERLKESMEKEQSHKEKELMMEANLKEAHLKVLQSQINPHFLFNTLNAGVQLAMLENADKTYDYIQKVASFYRYNIATGNESLLSEEIGIVDTYIYILNVRFSGEIKYEKYIEDEKYLNIYMPGMILQPIVENAINHGIRDIAWEGKIELSVCRVDDNICISIADNGVGITKDVIDKILDGTYRETATSDDGKNNGLGMNNVMERLNLYYNGKNGFEIISNGKNQGTEIVITIPYEENGDV